MKILIILDYFQPKLGYSETFIAWEYMRKGYEVLVVTSDHFYPFPDYEDTSGQILGQRKQNVGYFIEEGIPTKREKLKFEIFNRSYFENIEKNISDFKPDVIIVNGIASITTIVVARLKDKYNFKLACFDSNLMSIINHGLMIKQVFYFIFRLFFSKYLGGKVDKFIGVQEETCEIIYKFYGISQNKIEFIPLGTDVEKFRFDESERNNIREQYNIPKNAIVLVYTGKLILDKGYDLLIKATSKIIDENKNVYIIVIGSGPKHLINEMSIYINNSKDNYKFVNFVKNEELYKYFSASDAGIWPLQESVSMIEAAACNLPFIANDKIGTRLRISNNNALLYKQGDTEDLYKKIKYLVENDQERINMGKRGRELVENKLCWNTISEKYLKFKGK